MACDPSDTRIRELHKMRAFAVAYLVFAAVLLGVLFLLQLPGVLIVLLVYTMGIGYLLVLPVINFGFWVLLFAPAAMGAWLNWRIGAGVAALILGLVVTFPRWLPDPAHDGMALLEAPLAATGPVEVRSVEITSEGRHFARNELIEPAIEALKRNTDLEWIRVGGTVFERRDGILHQARRTGETHRREADVVIAIPLGRHSGVWGNAPLSPWRVEDVTGYLIHDTRTDKPLARNLSLEVLRAVRPVLLEVTDLSMDASSDPKIEFVRAPYGEVDQDPARTLEDDLRTLGLWRDAAEPELEPANPTNSPAGSVDAVLERMLQDRDLAQHEGSTSRGPDGFERQVIDDFNAQLAARVAIAERIDLIARTERSKLPGLDRALIVDIAAETPVLMQRMVDLYYTDLAEGASVHRVLDRVARSPAHAPLARAIGRDRERFLLALGSADRHRREFLIGNIFTFGVEDPYAILRTLFLPSPPGDPLEARLVEGYRAEWTEAWRRDAILENLRGGWEADKSAMQAEADMVMQMLLQREDVPRDVLIGLVEDWVMTRRSPILHDYRVLLDVLEGLEEIGAEELRADLLVYFADFIEHRPHWMDAPA